jgi:hypothetical protein
MKAKVGKWMWRNVEALRIVIKRGNKLTVVHCVSWFLLASKCLIIRYVRLIVYDVVFFVIQNLLLNILRNLPFFLSSIALVAIVWCFSNDGNECIIRIDPLDCNFPILREVTDNVICFGFWIESVHIKHISFFWTLWIVRNKKWNEKFNLITKYNFLLSQNYHQDQ